MYGHCLHLGASIYPYEQDKQLSAEYEHVPQLVLQAAHLLAV